MNNFKLTKSCIIVIVAAILAVLMLVCTFLGNSTTLEYMQELEFPGILLWIYYIAFAGTVVFSILQKLDFAKLAAIVNLSVFVLALLVMIIDYGHNFMRWINIGIFGCLVASIVALISVLKESRAESA